jgi:hypothetical protein
VAFPLIGALIAAMIGALIASLIRPLPASLRALAPLLVTSRGRVFFFDGWRVCSFCRRFGFFREVFTEADRLRGAHRFIGGVLYGLCLFLLLTAIAAATAPAPASAPAAYGRFPAFRVIGYLAVLFRMRQRIRDCEIGLLVRVDLLAGEVATEFDGLARGRSGFGPRRALIAPLVTTTMLPFATAAAAPTLVSTSAFALRLLLACGLGYDLFIFVFFFHALDEVGDVQERVAFQADLDERRLHARKHACDFAFVNGSREGVFVLALEIDFYDAVIFDDREFGLMRGRSDE